MKTPLVPTLRRLAMPVMLTCTAAAVISCSDEGKLGDNDLKVRDDLTQEMASYAQGGASEDAEVIPAEIMAAGEAAYAICAACHGPDGAGLDLGGGMMMAPALAGSPVVNGDPSLSALVILHGIEKEGTDFVGMMAPLAMEDDQLAAVLTYTRNSFGNSAGLVTPEQAAEFRAQWADRTAPVKRAELTELTK